MRTMPSAWARAWQMTPWRHKPSLVATAGTQRSRIVAFFCRFAGLACVFIRPSVRACVRAFDLASVRTVVACSAVFGGMVRCSAAKTTPARRRCSLPRGRTTSRSCLERDSYRYRQCWFSPIRTVIGSFGTLTSVIRPLSALLVPLPAWFVPYSAFLGTLIEGAAGRGT